MGENTEYDALGFYILSHRSTSLRFFMVPFLKVNRGEFIFLPFSLPPSSLACDMLALLHRK